MGNVIKQAVNQDVAEQDDSTEVLDSQPVIEEQQRQQDSQPKQIQQIQQLEDIKGLTKPNDRAGNIEDLQSKFERLEMMMKLSKHNDIVDIDIVSDLIQKGWDLNKLRESKPYLFTQIKTQVVDDQSKGNTVKRIIAETKSPKSVGDIDVYNDKFVNALINELKVTDFD